MDIDVSGRDDVIFGIYGLGDVAACKSGTDGNNLAVFDEDIRLLEGVKRGDDFTTSYRN